jgi:outer membrane protein, multidrug efflux system
MEKTSKQLRTEYLNGMSNYLDVLTALHEEQRLRRDLLTAKLLLLEYRIALYRSLAGGFETEREQLSMENN